MKHLTEYLTESFKTYEYRIKIAGELPEEFIKRFKMSLGAFDIQDMSDVSETPIQADPLGFPGLKNEKVSIIDIALAYPAGMQKIVELATMHGVDTNNIVVVDKAFNDSMITDLTGIEDVESILVSDYPEQSKEQNAASEAYADSFKKAAAEFANASSYEFEIAKAEKSDVKNSTPEEDGVLSPLSKVTRKPIKDSK